TASSMDDQGDAVEVTFSDGDVARYDVVIGADGVHSSTRQQLFPDAPRPQFTGQGVWRHNFERPPEVTSLHAYAGPKGMGLVPLAAGLMYLFLTTPEPGNPHYASS